MATQRGAPGPRLPTQPAGQAALRVWGRLLWGCWGPSVGFGEQDPGWPGGDHLRVLLGKAVGRGSGGDEEEQEQQQQQEGARGPPGRAGPGGAAGPSRHRHVSIQDAARRGGKEGGRTGTGTGTVAESWVGRAIGPLLSPLLSALLRAGPPGCPGRAPGTAAIWPPRRLQALLRARPGTGAQIAAAVNPPAPPSPVPQPSSLSPPPCSPRAPGQSSCQPTGARVLRPSLGAGSPRPPPLLHQALSFLPFCPPLPPPRIAPP